MKNCIVVTGGGTAGHIMPIIALLPELKKHYKQIVYIGSHNGMEKQIIKNYPFVRFCEVDCVKFDRVHLFKNLAIPFALFKAIRQCKHIIKAHKVDCIFSKGGYVSLPVVLASGRIPVIAHESDMTLGLANKIIYHKARVMCTSFEMAKRRKKFVFTGLPIRDFLPSKMPIKLKLDKGKQTLLVMGGSLGSEQINQTFYLICGKVCNSFNVIHIVGKGNLTNAKMPRNYNAFEFVDNMADVYSVIDLAICRAGATTICELMHFNVPMLLIPLSSKVSRGDQEQNAEYYKNNGYAFVLKSEELTANNLLESINNLSQNAKTIKQKQGKETQNATHLVLEQILKFSK